MKVILLVLWLILLPMTTMGIALPLSRSTKLENLSYSRVFLFLVLWPFPLVFHINKYQKYLTTWQNELENGKIKRWQALLLFLVAPLLLFGLLEGHGDLGGFGFTLIVLVGCVGNLLLYIQIVKLLGIV